MFGKRQRRSRDFFLCLSENLQYTSFQEKLHQCIPDVSNLVDENLRFVVVAVVVAVAVAIAVAIVVVVVNLCGNIDLSQYSQS